MMLSGVSVYGFGGAFELGAKQAGVRLLPEPKGDGFAQEILSENRRFLYGERAASQYAYDEDADGDWQSTGNIGYLFGNPPCSGFSHYNRYNRGRAAPQNGCMRRLVKFAAGQEGLDGHPGPEVVVIESVQAAYRDGQGLMRSLRSHLEKRTAQDYDLHHVLHNALHTGNSQHRPRYFAVFARVPFHPAHAAVKRSLENALENAPYLRHISYVPSGNQEPLDAAGDWAWNSPHVRRVRDVLRAGLDWPNGSRLKHVLANANGKSPESVRKYVKAPSKIRTGAFGNAVRLSLDRPSYTVFGKGDIVFVHPRYRRVLSAREYYALMGFPRRWRVTGHTSAQQVITWAGKQVTVDAARWISTAVAQALQGDTDTDKYRHALRGGREAVHWTTAEDTGAEQ